MVIEILGVKVDRVTFASACEQIASFIDHGQPHQVVTVNPEFIMRAQSDRAFRKVLNEADLSVPDGAGLLWASRWQARRRHSVVLPERVTGTDLLPALAQRAAHEQWRIYLLGGQPGVAARTAEILKLMEPAIRIVGAESGPIIGDDGKPINRDQAAINDALLTRIRHAQPDLLFAAFGAPKQDRYLARYRHDLGVPVMIGVGGAFDFLTGATRRAPNLIRLLWLEWLWRLLLEPWRIGRIWTAVVRFPLAVISSKLNK